MKYPRWIRRTALLASVVALGTGGSHLRAQEPEVKVIPASTKKCTCGRWTCPTCQQRKLQQVCPPGQVVPILPNMTVPSQPAPIYDSEGNAVPLPTPTPTTPESPQPSPNAGNSFNLNDSLAMNQPQGADVAREFNQFGRGESFGSSRGSGTSLADPGLFGDFFGPTSNTNSIISQNYIVDATGTLNGGVYDFDVPGNLSANDISAAGPGPAGVGGTVALGFPASPTDLTRPNEPGYVFGGGNATLLSTTPSNIADQFRLNYGYTKSVSVPSSFAQQRMKLAENTSPLPQNRIFVNYSLFHNVPLENGITVNRISPGFETLLFNPNTSFEMRTPFATTLDSNILLDGGTNTSNVEFGNLYFSLKQVLWRRNSAAISGGLSMTVPTADPTRVINGLGQEVVRIENQSVHLMPFLGAYYKPSQRAFLQGVLQVDIDANGNTVLQNNNLNQSSLTRIGRLQDLTLLYTDLGAGFWMYRGTGSGLTGVAPMAEIHYNRSLNDADCVIDPTGRTRIQLPIQQFDNINLVSAMVFEFNQRSRLGLGLGVPVGNGTDRAFDGELRATFNRYY